MVGLKRFRPVLLAACVLVAALAVPAAATAGPVGDIVDDVGGTVNGTVDEALGGGSSGVGGGASGGGGPVPAAGTPPSYTPPAHGTSPHGSGTVGVVDVTPESSEPLPYEPGGGSEDVVVGRSYGEQGSSGYHGHVTILALLGNELLGVDTNEGETDSGPLGPLNDALGDICTGSGGQLCLTILGVNSQTDASGSSNSFQAAEVNVGTGENSIRASAGNSSGNISENGSCQTAEGSSSVADASVLGAVSASVINSRSQSRACSDGSSSQTNSSQVLNINEKGVPLPAPGCEDGTPNTVLDLGIVSFACNAADSSDAGGTQLPDPYGVREGLSVFVAPILGEVAKGTTAASESHAVAPAGAAPVAPDGGGEPDGGGRDGGGGGKGGAGEAGGAGAADGSAVLAEADAPTAGPSEDQLAFTGSDLLTLALLGFGITSAGLGLMALADRRRPVGA